ncbi:type II secretion system F family protein [Catelliglobosispora koreensis]|uniref:type II secretion system F family protein n=1 Tax=Catelliglobosispora koreensis TaxID=129052 RepID=UPI00036CFCC4|nr:type II secretion system F family protein [Catelliglobosispora koreensis]
MAISVVAIAIASVVIGLLTRSGTAGAMVLGYGVAGLLWLRQHRVRVEADGRRADSLETLAAMAADLRAGANVSDIELPDDELARLVTAAVRVSEETGAGLAALLERLEAQHRALSRVDSSAHAQAAGIRLTVLLLFLLPLGALVTGIAMGADPFQVLWHTDAGTLCAAVAFALQLAGLAWANKLARPANVQAHRELAFAADLIAAALVAGATLDQALLRAAEVLPGPARQRILAVSHALRWGVDSTRAWDHLAQEQKVRRTGLFQTMREAPAAVAERRLSRAAKRSSHSGAALAGALSRCADDLRDDAAHERQTASQRAAVLLVLPLGLCFLPAFLLSGLVPVVIAVLSQVMWMEMP